MSEMPMHVERINEYGALRPPIRPADPNRSHA
jgi:hypothetical protein